MCKNFVRVVAAENKQNFIFVNLRAILCEILFFFVFVASFVLLAYDFRVLCLAGTALCATALFSPFFCSCGFSGRCSLPCMSVVLSLFRVFLFFNSAV